MAAVNSALAASTTVQEPSIMLEKSAVHVVQRGDNLFTIAKKYGTTVHALLKANGLRKRALLKLGMELKIPNKPDSSKSEASRRGRRLIRVSERDMPHE
jgi:LysM repeat protein